MKDRLGTVLLLCLALALPPTYAVAGNIALAGVTVVDVTDGSMRPGQSVYVEGNRIAAIGPTDAVKVPASAEIVRGDGRYLIPGLWDAHVHSAGGVSWHFPLYLAYGITSVRNMHSSAEKPLELVNSIKRRLASGELLGPRFLANGGVVDGDPPVWPGSVVVRNAEEARQAVDTLADGGADFIKVYDFLTRESYFAVLDEARQRGIPVDGHLPFPITPEEAAAAGQRTIEHTSGISIACSSDADAIRRDFDRYVEERPDMAPYPDAMVAFFELVRRSIETRDPKLCMSTVRAYREYGVAVVPTLGANAGSDSQSFVHDPSQMNLLPPAIQAQWRGMARAGRDPIETLLGPLYDVVASNVRLLNQEHIAILAGTDVGNPFLVPGLSLHRELLALNAAGLSPLETLQAATIQPVRVFGLAESLGTVEVGMLADLVLLDANPLEDVANTQRIHAVVADGRLLRRADLDRLVAEAQSVDLSAGP